MDVRISIHALLAESDNLERPKHCTITNFYPRSPCGERLDEADGTLAALEFLSTLSLRRATSGRAAGGAGLGYFYPRSPCGERRNRRRRGNRHKAFLSTLSLRRATKAHQRVRPGSRISIHALLAESDNCPAVIVRATLEFLSTLSLRRATAGAKATENATWNFYPRSPCGERHVDGMIDRAAYDISIHALLAESDSSTPAVRSQFMHFYPRSPCGERLKAYRRTSLAHRFLSTLSLRRATNINSSVNTADQISIHALLAESDHKCHRVDRVQACISIHALLAESDPPVREIIQWEGIFLSTLSLRRATLNGLAMRWNTCISIHALLAESDLMMA